MRIGINGTDNLSDLDSVVEAARAARDEGFSTYWAAQIFSLDALTALAVVGREVDGIELGTAVVPTYPRHPMALAGQALTTQAASGGRLSLGIGLSHQIVVEGMWGMSYDKPVRHMREYLDCLLPLLRGESASFKGEVFTTMGAITVDGATPPPVQVAALGSQMLAVAGSRGCGTSTWCTGPKTLADHIVPKLTAAAEKGGHPAPRVVAALPVVVTADPDGARSRAAHVFALYGGLPAYRAMMDLEGVDGPADLGIFGDEEAVSAGVRALAEAGVTDFSAVVSTGDEKERQLTRTLLAELAQPA